MKKPQVQWFLYCEMHLPAALGDGLINGFVNLLIVVVLVSSVLPHVGFERGRMTAHVATQRTPKKKKKREGNM